MCQIIFSAIIRKKTVLFVDAPSTITLSSIDVDAFRCFASGNTLSAYATSSARYCLAHIRISNPHHRARTHTHAVKHAHIHTYWIQTFFETDILDRRHAIVSSVLKLYSHIITVRVALLLWIRSRFVYFAVLCHILAIHSIAIVYISLRNYLRAQQFINCQSTI